jgi:RNA ligase (TIGR02306 family)
MSRKLAYVAKIKDLQPIKGKDRIELATILGWEVIVQKNEYKIGDLVIYCEYDTILPVRPEFEFLRSRCYSAKWNGFRIRNMRLSGIFSQGIIFPISILGEVLSINNKDIVIKLK